ncbi:helix-turn-helix transcriptional regulator [Caldichromatium japonicum]|uniref:Helix-turn-helix transcriptional regulator n=1 Tax=Caldichromatium japonicum TaxID=2699430 RepID=A0A6G7VF03_9GAMM|nr:helix-turn-helix transcriptional regulator [Caldichromatium japonicum]QIK38532.1 helix-turn-helix transcriptional regulator [Caldichromatium japonicum]
MRFFLLGAQSFLRETLLARGLIHAAAPFSPRERQVLALLLTDANEKEIARQLAIGHRTVHQHAEAIYAKLGVRGRVGLMALWLRHQRAGQADPRAPPSAPLRLPEEAQANACRELGWHAIAPNGTIF